MLTLPMLHRTGRPTYTPSHSLFYIQVHTYIYIYTLEVDENDQKVFQKMLDKKKEQDLLGKSKLFVCDTEIKGEKGKFYNNRIEVETLEQYEQFGRRSLYSPLEFEKQSKIFPHFYKHILPNDSYLNSRLPSEQHTETIYNINYY